MDFNKDQAKTTQQPEKSAIEKIKSTFESAKAGPGPAIPDNFNAPQEGTKEERMAKAKDLNKEAHIQK